MVSADFAGDSQTFPETLVRSYLAQVHGSLKEKKLTSLKHLNNTKWKLLSRGKRAHLWLPVTQSKCISVLE
jgi:hypothetical protein